MQVKDAEVGRVGWLPTPGRLTRLLAVTASVCIVVTIASLKMGYFNSLTTSTGSRTSERMLRHGGGQLSGSNVEESFTDKHERIKNGGHEGMCQKLPSEEQEIFINEIHYDDVGLDEGEGVEIAGPPGTNLRGLRLELYDSMGKLYWPYTVEMDGWIPDHGKGMGLVFVSVPGLGDGVHGIALVNDRDHVLLFLSYEGTIHATMGAAADCHSDDIGVRETGFDHDSSLQLAGAGFLYGHFLWQEPATSSYSRPNPLQTLKNVVRTCEACVPDSGIALGVGEEGDGSIDVGEDIQVTLDAKIASNARFHNTEMYSSAVDDLVVRRGDNMDFSVSTSVQVDVDAFQVWVSDVGVKETERSLPEFQVTLRGGDVPAMEFDGSVVVPGDVATGWYTLHVLVNGRYAEKRYGSFDFIVLFNPWSKRSMYGHIWRGSRAFKEPVVWGYEQFDTNNIEMALEALRSLTREQRESPRATADALMEHVSTMCQPLHPREACKTDIVLAGSEGCQRQPEWMTSTVILRHQREGEFVHCHDWEYSPLLVTFGRALGIPSRVVTGYEVGVDTEQRPYADRVSQGLYVDRFWQERYGFIDMVDAESEDKVLPFRMWTEMFFQDSPHSTGKCLETRGDGDNGWFAIEPSPAELPGDPVPSTSLRDLVLNNKHTSDISKFQTFVNGDIQHHILEMGGSRLGKSGFGYSLVKTEVDRIGDRVITQGPSGEFDMDLTNTYKIDEPSSPNPDGPWLIISYYDEADRFNPYPSLRYPEEQVLAFDFECEPFVYGESLKASLGIQTKGEEHELVKVHVNFRVIHTNHRGEDLGIIGRVQQALRLEDGSKSAETTMEIDFSSYRDLFGESPYFRVDVGAKVKQTEQLFLHSETVLMKGPELTVKCLAPDVVTREDGSDPSTRFVSVQFTNPLYDLGAHPGNNFLTGVRVRMWSHNLIGPEDELSVPLEHVLESFDYTTPVTLKEGYDPVDYVVMVIMESDQFGSIRGHGHC